MNKKVIVFLALVGGFVAVSSGAYFSYEYFQKGSPNYSFIQFKKAYAEHDVTSAKIFMDSGAISNNLWPRVKTKLFTSLSSSEQASPLTSGLIDAQEGHYKDLFETATYEMIRGTGNNDAPIRKVLVQFFTLTNPDFVIHGDKATLHMDYASELNNTIYKLDFVFTRTPDRMWQLVDIQGFEDLLGESQIKDRDTRRINDIKQLQLAFELYFDANPNHDYPDSLSQLLAPTACGTGPCLSNMAADPLDGGDYSYCHVAAGSYVLGASLEDKTNPALSSAYVGPVDNICLGGGTSVHSSHEADCAGANKGARFCYAVRP